MHTDPFRFDGIICLLQAHQALPTALESLFRALIQDLNEHLHIYHLSLSGPCELPDDKASAPFQLRYPSKHPGCADFQQTGFDVRSFPCPEPDKDGGRVMGIGGSAQVQSDQTQVVDCKVTVTDGEPWWVTLHFRPRRRWFMSLPLLRRPHHRLQINVVIESLRSALIGPLSIVNLRFSSASPIHQQDSRFTDTRADTGTEDWHSVAKPLPGSINLAVMDALADGIWLLDSQGLTQHINPAFSEFFSLDIAWARHRNYHEFIVTDSRTAFASAMNRALQGQHSSLDVAFLSRELGPLWARISMTPLYADDRKASAEPATILCLVRGLARERKAVSAWNRIELQLRKTQARVRLGLITRNSDGSQFDCTPEIYRITGHNASRQALTQDSYFSYVHPEDRGQVIKDWNSALSAQDMSRQTEYRILRQDETQLWVSSQIESRFSSEDVLESITVSIQDISIHKGAELDLKKLINDNKRLARQAQKTLEQERSRVARELHDSVGQTITGIKLSAEWIKRKTEQYEGLEQRAADIAEQSALVLDEIRQICRQLNPVILQKVGLEAAAHELTDGWAWRNVETELELSIPTPLGPIDDERSLNLYRVLQELLHNVSKHADAEYVLVALRWFSATPFDHLELEVADNGQGFDTNALTSGSGLIGLRDRAMNLGGWVTFTSQPGKGTQVVFRVPIPTPDTSSADAEQ